MDAPWEVWAPVAGALLLVARGVARRASWVKRDRDRDGAEPWAWWMIATGVLLFVVLLGLAIALRGADS